ncbi:hypothetical protein [Halomonas litopenaei]|uniref:hypothetical protein n=1 Tax=Halomonas litopenaei TaxID=2109328 RepID=UPI001A8F6B9F|nr:hypothetical protein [Halomonas litopenaei]MBN8412993.1 hypothetical protein [Halomonas litopenaei]
MLSNKTAAAWSEWLSAVSDQRSLMQEIAPQLSDAKEQCDRFQSGAHYYARTVAGALRKNIGEHPDKAERERVATELRQVARSHKARRHDTAESVGWSQNLTNLDDCERSLEQAQQRLDDLSEQHDAI